jgi:hypothetical protein
MQIGSGYVKHLVKAEEPYPMQIGRGLCRVLDVSTQEEEQVKAEEPYPMQIEDY